MTDAMPQVGLPMYDMPWIADATDGFCAAIAGQLRGRGLEIPDTPWRGEDLIAHWTDPALVLSQTCSLPMRTLLRDRVTLVAAPDFGLPGCPPGQYNSVILMRRGDARHDPTHWPDLRLAFNQVFSHSGWATAVAASRAAKTSFGSFVETGAHRASVAALAEGRADIAFVDAQSWRLLAPHMPEARELAEHGRTPPTAAMPYITASGRDPEPIRAALHDALASLPEATQRALGLTGIVDMPLSAYHHGPVPD